MITFSSPEQRKIPEYWLYWTYRCRELLCYPLRSSDGAPITIIDPGEKNDDNGPDFRNAVVEINGVRCRGDVEFHVLPQDWFRHGHQQDERYRNVILHVVWDIPDSLPSELAARFPHLALRRQLKLTESRWREKMKTLEEKKRSPGRLSSLPPPTLNDIAGLAELRFRRKIERLKDWCRLFPLETVFYITLAEALGYSKNKFPFRQLLWENPPDQIYAAISPLQRSPLSIWAYLALCGGLLESPAFLNFKTSASPAILLANSLFQQFQERGFYPILKRCDWNFSRVRPHNHPCLRLAALAQILYRYQSPSLFQKLLTISMRRHPLAETLRQWHSCFRFPFDPLTGQVLQTLLGIRPLPQILIGNTRQRQFFLNGLLPLLHIWADFTGNEGFRVYLGGLYESFPSTEEQTFLKAQIRFISDSRLASQFHSSGFLQQGMIEYLTTQHNPAQL